MIVGIGVDIVPWERVKLLAQRTPRLMDRLLTRTELKDCKKRNNPWPHVAARYAAKEAMIKALGHFVPLKEVEISLDPSGKPVVISHGKTRRLLRRKSLRCHISLSHDGGYSCAFVILEDSERPKFPLALR